MKRSYCSRLIASASSASGRSAASRTRWSGAGARAAALMGIAAVLLAPRPAVAAPQFVAYHNQPGVGHQAYFNSLSVDGFRMRSLSVYHSEGDPRYAAIWVKQAGPAYAAFHGKSPAGYQAFFNTWVAKGYRPTLLTATGDGADAVFAAVFEKDTTPFLAKHGISAGQFNDTNQWAKSNGFILRCATIYGTAAAPVYAGVWEKNTKNVAWWIHHGLSGAQYQNLFNIYGGTSKRLVFATMSPGYEYLALWCDVPSGAWVSHHGMTSAGYQGKFDNLVPPYAPTCVQAKGEGAGIRFVAIWDK